jgi:hypothetical protein
VYYTKVLQRRDQILQIDGGHGTPIEGRETKDTVEALKYLADYCKNTRDYDSAIEYCNRLQEVGYVTIWLSPSSLLCVSLPVIVLRCCMVCCCM